MLIGMAVICRIHCSGSLYCNVPDVQRYVIPGKEGCLPAVCGKSAEKDAYDKNKKIWEKQVKNFKNVDI